MLPNATETKIFVTANARALRHFIEMRGDAAADVEIRRLAVAVCKLMQKEAPNLFGDYTLIDLPTVGRRLPPSFARSKGPFLPVCDVMAAPGSTCRSLGNRVTLNSPDSTSGRSGEPRDLSSLPQPARQRGVRPHVRDRTPMSEFELDRDSIGPEIEPNPRSIEHRSPRASPSNRCPVCGSRNQTRPRTRISGRRDGSVFQEIHPRQTIAAPSKSSSQAQVGRRPSRKRKDEGLCRPGERNRTRKKCWSRRRPPSTPMSRAVELGI